MQPTKRHLKVIYCRRVGVLFITVQYYPFPNEVLRRAFLRLLHAGARVRDAREVRRVGARGSGYGLRVRRERAARALLVSRRRVLPRAPVAQTEAGRSAGRRHRLCSRVCARCALGSCKQLSNQCFEHISRAHVSRVESLTRTAVHSTGTVHSALLLTAVITNTNLLLLYSHIFLEFNHYQSTDFFRHSFTCISIQSKDYFKNSIEHANSLIYYTYLS